MDKKISFFIVTCLLSSALYAMEAVKTALVVAPTVTALGLTTDILYERIKQGNFDFLNKKSLKNMLANQAGPVAISLGALIPAMHFGEQPEASVTGLLKPAVYAVCTAATLSLVTGLVVYHSKSAHDVHKELAAQMKGYQVFYYSTFVGAPFVLAIVMLAKRQNY